MSNIADKIALLVALEEVKVKRDAQRAASQLAEIEAKRAAQEAREAGWERARAQKRAEKEAAAAAREALWERSRVLKAKRAKAWDATLRAREAKAAADAPLKAAKAAQAEANRQRREAAFKRAEVGRRVKAGEVHRQRMMELDHKLDAASKADDSDQPNSDYAQLRAIAVAPENFVFFEQRLPFFDKTAGWDDDTE